VRAELHRLRGESLRQRWRTGRRTMGTPATTCLRCGLLKVGSMRPTPMRRVLTRPRTRRGPGFWPVRRELLGGGDVPPHAAPPRSCPGRGRVEYAISVRLSHATGSVLLAEGDAWAALAAPAARGRVSELDAHDGAFPCAIGLACRALGTRTAHSGARRRAVCVS
jgi:hypothetical protein